MKNVFTRDAVFANINKPELQSKIHTRAHTLTLIHCRITHGALMKLQNQVFTSKGLNVLHFEATCWRWGGELETMEDERRKGRRGGKWKEVDRKEKQSKERSI